MNNKRRGQIKEVISGLYNVLDSIKDDEEYAFDNMPEGLQYSANGERSQECIESMEEALEHLEEAISLLEDTLI